MVDVRRTVVPTSALLLMVLAACSAPGTDRSHDEIDKVVPWTLDHVTGNDVTVRTAFGGCLERPRVTVEETSATVRIQALSTLEQGNCPDGSATVARTVTLRSPLGTRALSGCDATDSGSTIDCRTVDPLRLLIPSSDVD
jgi:hypothetical protein